MRFNPIFYNLFFAILLSHAYGQYNITIGITPNEPMVYCNINDEFTGVDIISDGISSELNGYDIDLIKFVAYTNRWDLPTLKIICLDSTTLLSKIDSGELTMGTGGIAITAYKQLHGYEFSLPTYTAGTRLIAKTLKTYQLWSFFDSFEPLLWIVILATTLGTGIVTWILEDQSFQFRKNPERWKTNLKEMIWQAASGLFYQSEVRLQKFPARVVWLCFWFMALILTATYTADLTTKMTAQNPKLKFTSLQGAASAKGTIATLAPFQSIVASYNVEDLIVKPWDQESLLEIENMFLNSEVDGIVLDVPAAIKFNSKFPCSSVLFSTAISSFNYGFIYRNDIDTTFAQSVDSAIMKVKESLEFQSVLNQNIYVAPQDGVCQSQLSITKLTMTRLGGLWIIFAGAIVLAVILDRVGSNVVKKQGKEGEKPLTNKKVEEMDAEEKKFVMDSYLMISDYIHIPSSDIHLKLEDDMKNALENVEQVVKNRFNNVEKKIIDILNTNSKALGLIDGSNSDINSQGGEVPQESDFNFKFKMD